MTPAMITEKTTAQLIEVFIMTGHVNNPYIPTVRGWIMDELQARDPEAFDAWLDSETCEDAYLPLYFH